MGLALLQAFSIGFGFIAPVVVILVVGSILYSAVKVVKEYERGVIFRLGRAQGGPRALLAFPVRGQHSQDRPQDHNHGCALKDVSEYQASERLRQAADRLESPTALQSRLFQTMGEIAVNQNSTIILPVPIDLFKPFLESQNETDGPHHATHREEDAERLYEEAVGDISPETKTPAENQTPEEARSGTELTLRQNTPPGEARACCQGAKNRAGKCGRRTQRAARGLASNTSG